MPDSKYESDDGDIHYIRLAAKTIAAAGGAPAGPIDSDIKVKVSKTNREHGIRPRYVRIKRTISTGNGGPSFNVYRRIPVLTPAAFDGAAFAQNAAITYDGQSWTVSGREPEDY